jgi:tellurite resistance-related uncharacterized protein
MAKVALCFLVYDKFECENIWKKWLENNNSRFSIYIHSKNKFKTTLTEAVNMVPTVPTEWGKFSLLKATCKLYEEALKDPANKKFVLLSQACIPFKSPDYIYNFLMKDNMSYYYNYDTSKQVLIKYQTLQKRLPLIQIEKHSQWIIVNREHSQYLIEFLPMLEIAFTNAGDVIPDESWFLIVMNMLNKKHETVFKPTTFVSWHNVEKDWSPFRITNVSEETLAGFVNNPDYLFGRRFENDIPIWGKPYLSTVNIIDALWSKQYQTVCNTVHN